MQFALALATCVLAQPLAEAPAKHARMTLYYIPFAAETYVAVTEKTIKKSAYHTIEVDSPERIAALEAVLADRKGKGRFNRSSVRLLVVPRSPATADILVDSEGRVSEGGVTSALSTEAFTSLKRILSELTAEPRTSHPNHSKGEGHMRTMRRPVERRLETIAERTRANAAELVPERVASGTP